MPKNYRTTSMQKKIVAAILQPIRRCSLSQKRCKVGPKLLVVFTSNAPSTAHARPTTRLYPTLWYIPSTAYFKGVVHNVI